MTPDSWYWGFPDVPLAVVRGHLSGDECAALLLAEHEVASAPDQWEQGYARWGLGYSSQFPGPDALTHHHLYLCEPGRGAFPVTVCEPEEVVP